jgi:hypothetical protein
MRRKLGSMKRATMGRKSLRHQVAQALGARILNGEFIPRVIAAQRGRQYGNPGSPAGGAAPPGSAAAE